MVVPHCATCREPCCALRTVVLELDWRRLRALYDIPETQRAFDARLAAGQGPSYLRKQGDTYYAHGEPCPAWDVTTRRCRVYGTDLKPPTCTDFPVYADGDGITADTRCEAVAVETLRRHLETSAGARLRAEPDEDFPELVTLVPLQRRDRERSSS